MGEAVRHLSARRDAARLRQAKPFHDALVAANPQNLVWGTDWPHPRPEGRCRTRTPLAVFRDWTRDPAQRQAILTDNPARLYDFPRP